MPGALRTVTSWIRKARALTYEFRNSIDDLAEEVELENISNELQSDLGIDETKEFRNSIKEGIQTSIDPNGEISEVLSDTSVIYNEDLIDREETQSDLGTPTESNDQIGEVASSLGNNKKPEKGIED